MIVDDYYTVEFVPTNGDFVKGWKVVAKLLSITEDKCNFDDIHILNDSNDSQRLQKNWTLDRIQDANYIIDHLGSNIKEFPEYFL